MKVVFNQNARLIYAFALIAMVTLAAGCSSDNRSPASNNAAQDSQSDSIDATTVESQAEDALQVARRALIASPDDPKLLTDAARATAAAGDRTEAAMLLSRAAEADDFDPTRVQWAVRALLEVGELYPAIELLSRALETDSDNSANRRLLFGLLGEAGRTDLMPEHYRAIIRNREFDVAVLLACTDTSQRLFPAEAIEAMIERNPSDHRLRLGIAQSLCDQRRFSDAEAVLREMVQHHADFAPALALLGRMPSVQQAGDQAFADWLNAALPHCRGQVEFWIALGERHFQSEDFTAALSCSLAATRINPNRVIPWSQISQTIRRLDSGAAISDSGEQMTLRDDDADRIIRACDQYARDLLDLRMHLQRFGASGESSQHAAAEIARVLVRMGRCWEAEAWSAVAMTLPDERDPELDELRRAIIENLKRNRSWNTPPDLAPLDSLASDPVTQVNRSGRRVGSANRPAVLGNDDAIHWADETGTRNLVVPTVPYPDIASSLIHSMGSGGGTIDFDLDGWSDLFFCSPVGQTDQHTDPRHALLRNLDGVFRNVTLTSGCRSAEIGQGVAVGDYNEDGFADLFIANIGANRLLRNNGDGSFSDATRSLGASAIQWTTCGAWVDLNLDGIVDLVAVNYCSLTGGVDLPCQSDGRPAPCHPAKFAGDQDQILLGDGRGALVDSLGDPLKQITPGRGLGILAGRLTDHSQSALVANDMSANHWHHLTKDGLIEAAVPRGIAVDGQSLAQASMGIAGGDFDGDLDLDVYVTGFAREYNIYYEQQTGGSWVDSTAAQALIEPTRMMVGFGTQAVDMDADGIDELAITNGHIGDFGPDQPPLAQPFQLFRRSPQGTFQIIERASDDAYLAASHIGRALWKIDVDQDLADDLIITHQNAPPTLLANRTKTDHRRIGLRCVGTTCSRDAIGTVIDFIASGHPRRLWLLSGDGYMSSNERILKAGIGSSDRIDDVCVTWPDGTVESFGTLTAGRTYLLIEGSGEAFSTNSTSDARGSVANHSQVDAAGG
ncbi:FG-GAP-like repeat-containing protein [Rhodopirellula sp. JC639]|uniref:FG-GAP-like repeat-containing protein n=1 Tax=Stieleria mannarensis TaxID=2755585 RepID=UPI0016029BA9|nr:FG-GAP-like repeat-containing protein [Rhodopirellula sp. JC639]